MRRQLNAINHFLSTAGLALLTAGAIILTSTCASAQTGLCNWYAAGPTTPKVSCSTVPRIGQSFDLWWPQTTRGFAPPATLQAMYMGPNQPFFVLSWGVLGDQKILGWNPMFQVAMRILDSNNPGPYPPSSCSIPLQTCTWPAQAAYTVAVPNDPLLVGVLWYAGIINAWVGGTPPLITDPRHPGLDVGILIGT